MIWSNIDIPYKEIKDGLTHNQRGYSKTGYFNLSNFNLKHRKDQIIRNSVDPQVGKYILDCIEYER